MGAWRRRHFAKQEESEMEPIEEVRLNAEYMRKLNV